MTDVVSGNFPFTMSDLMRKEGMYEGQNDQACSWEGAERMKVSLVDANFQVYECVFGCLFGVV